MVLNLPSGIAEIYTAEVWYFKHYGTSPESQLAVSVAEFVDILVSAQRIFKILRDMSSFRPCLTSDGILSSLYFSRP